MRTLCWVLLLAAAVRPCAQLRVVTTLPEDVLPAVRAHLAAALADLPVDLESCGAAELAAAPGAPGDRERRADLYFAVDVQVLEGLAVAGRLRGYESPAAAALTPLGRAPADRYLVTAARPFVIAFRPDAFGRGGAPRNFDALLHPGLTGRLLLPLPCAEPSLYVQWLQSRFRKGFGEEDAFAWLGTLDARVGGYFDSAGETAAALAAGTGDVAVLPLDEARRARRRDPSIDFEVPEADLPMAGLGLALASECRQLEAARRVYDSLLATELARELALAHDVLPCQRKGLSTADLPDLLRRVRVVAMPCRPEPPLQWEHWSRRWDARVRGRGRPAETLLDVLDLVFGGLFVVFLYFVYKKTRSTEG